MILIPVHADHHWSLVVIMDLCSMSGCFNPQLHSEIPFIMHLDSATAHDPVLLSNSVRRWLVYEWHKLKGGMDRNIFLECYSPTITPAVAQ
jgi:Ulp1 family protease